MNKTLQLLGLAKQAGKVIDGEKRVLECFQKNQPLLIFIAKNAGENIDKKIHDKASSYTIDLIKDYTSEELSKAIGKENRVVLAVTDAGFIRSLKEHNLQKG